MIAAQDSLTAGWGTHSGDQERGIMLIACYGCRTSGLQATGSLPAQDEKNTVRTYRTANAEQPFYWQSWLVVRWILAAVRCRTIKKQTSRLVNSRTSIQQFPFANRTGETNGLLV